MLWGGLIRYRKYVNVYRNYYMGREKRSKGYSFHPTSFSAAAAAKEPPRGTVEVEHDVIDVQLNKQGVMDLLRQYASRPNNA